MKILYPSYGALGFALSVVGIPLFMYLPTYYASDIGVDITTVGIVLFVARALDMAIDPLIGHWSDQTKKRKPFIIAGSLLLLIGYYLLIHPLAYPVVWLFMLSMMVYIAWSLITVPYMALSSEITRDYHEKTTLSSWREVLTLLGMMSALSLPYVLNISDDYGATLQSLYLLLLISLPIALAALLWGVNNTFIPIQSIPFIQGLKTIFKSNGVFLVLAYCINALANAIPSTLFLYYVAHILHVPQESGMLLLLYFTAGIVALPFWSVLSRHIGKKHSWITSMVLASCAFAFVPFLGNGDLFWFILIVLVSGFSLGADLVLSSSLQADLAQKFVTKEQPLSGVLFGLWGMGTKLSLALGVGIAFGILGYFDFNPAAPSHQSHLALVYLYGISPVVLKILSISILVKFKENELT